MFDFIEQAEKLWKEKLPKMEAYWMPRTRPARPNSWIYTTIDGTEYAIPFYDGSTPTEEEY